MKSITRSELINILCDKFADSGLLKSDVTLSVKELVNTMSSAIASGDRIEIRGFGSFTLREENHAWVAIRKPANPSLWVLSMHLISNPEKI